MSTDDQDPRDFFLEGLDLSSCRVEFSEKPIVLLCGGQVRFKEHPDHDDPPILSLSHAIANATTSFEVFRPEEIDNWHSDAMFKDLVSFEKELASVCGMIVIVLESAGALVELGAFSQLPQLSDKLIAIISTNFSDDISFINLGVLRFIQKSKSASVKSYPWCLIDKNSITANLVDDVIADIQQELNNLPKTQIFRITEDSHIIVAICEILKIFIALKEGEIFEYLSVLKIVLDRERLRGQLFLLQKFHLVKTAKYSDATFYMRTTENYHRLRLSAKNGLPPIDAVRVTLQCREFYAKNAKQRNRLRAIEHSGRAGNGL